MHDVKPLGTLSEEWHEKIMFDKEKNGCRRNKSLGGRDVGGLDQGGVSRMERHDPWIFHVEAE